MWVFATDDNAVKAAVNIDPNHTIFELKTMLQRFYCCEPEFMVLTYNGYELERELTLHECGITDRSQVYVHTRLISI